MTAALLALALLGAPTRADRTALAHARLAEAHAARGCFADAGREYLTAFTWRQQAATLLDAADAFARAGSMKRADCLYRRYVAVFPTSDGAARARGEIARLGGACPVLP